MAATGTGTDRATRRKALASGAALAAAPAALATRPAGAAPGAAASDGPPAPMAAAVAPVTVVRLEERLRQRVVLQDHVLATIAGAVRRWWAGLSDPRRPIGSFLFLGPQGVGKTALAKAIAEHLFGSDAAMLRLNMRDYATPDAAARLATGGLTTAVAQRPYQVLLFDEVEKAHPDVLFPLQQILEAGRLRDAQGQPVDFRNTVVIMTTGVQGGAALPQTFPAEFLGRIGEIVTFNPLDRAQVRALLEAKRVAS